jgi:hypothetical protein
VVGQALFPHAKDDRGFIRFANGGVKYYRAPHSVFTTITGRNDNGVIVGEYAPANFPEGFMRNGSTFTPIVHPKSAPPYGTAVNGINKLNTVVGYYIENSNNYKARGFRRYSNGGYAALDYPNGTGTVPMGINDSGTVVGFFYDKEITQHGFIYHKGAWAKLDYPDPYGTTELKGISNDNVILGQWSDEDYTFAFLYENGVFKTISDPDAAGGTNTNSIATNGLITGDAYLDQNFASWRGFTAKCK